MFKNRTLYWIAVDIANQAGHDKMTFEDRVQFVESNIQLLKNFYLKVSDGLASGVALDELATNDGFQKMDSPFALKNAIVALFDYVTKGYASHMVYLDASNQALQLYAVLTADKETGKTCNLANGDTIADAYQLLANAMNKILGSSLTRSNCKKALMTTMYGKQDGSEEIINNLYPNDANFSEEHCLKTHGFTVEQLSSAFSVAIRDIAPKAMRAMDALTSLGELAQPTYRWTMEDGFNVKYDVKVKNKVQVYQNFKYSEMKLEKDIINAENTFNKTTQIKLERGEDISARKFNPMLINSMPPFELEYSTETYGANASSRGMSPNIIHSIDGYVAREMIRRMNGKFITTIHDAFACHPKDCDMMIQNYKNILCELLTDTMLSDLASQSAGTGVRIVKTNDLTCEDIQTSRYLLS